MLKRIYNKGLSILNDAIGVVQLFCERKGITAPVQARHFRLVKNSVLVQHAYPSNFKESDKALFSHYSNYQSQNEEIFLLNNVNISESGIVFKGFNNFGDAFPHTVFRTQYGWLYILRHYLFCKKINPETQPVYILLYDFWSAGNYYHWLVDALPRLAIVKQEMEDKGHSLLLPANAPKYITATLALMGITNITSIKKGQYLFANKLLVPYYLAGSGHIHPGRVREVKHFFTEKITAINPVDKIYVSRSRQKARRVVNEEQVIETLKALDFKIIYFEDYTFEEQVAIGKGAQIMVSSHGANLTNCLFMPSGAKVLELIRYDQPNFCYWALASVAGLQYNYQLCKVVGNDHLLVDMELFKQNLTSLLNE